MSVELRIVTPAEYDDFFAMFATYHRELDAFDPAAPDGTTPARRRQATLDDMGGRELLWVLADGSRAGFAIVRTLPDWPDTSREIASIAEFYIVPARRRSGVGRAAVEALRAEHRRRGSYRVEAEILRDNDAARAFWASVGFEVQSIVTAREP